MPIYMYLCGECNETREYFLNSGQHPVRCDGCDAPRSLKRVYDGQTLGLRSSSSKNNGGSNSRGLELLAYHEIFAPPGHKVMEIQIAKIKKP